MDYLHFVLQFNFTVARFPEKTNTAADVLYQFELDTKGEFIPRVKKDLPTKPNEVNIESTSIAQERPVFFDRTDQDKTVGKELCKHKEETRPAFPKDPAVMTVSCYYANGLHKDTTIVDIAQLSKPSRILIE